MPASIAPNSELTPLPPGTDASVPASNAPNNGLTPLPLGTDASVPASNAPNSELTPLPPGTDASVPASNAPNNGLTPLPLGTDASVPASNAPNSGFTPLPPGTDASVPASNAPNSGLTPLPPGTDANVPASNAPNSGLTPPPPGTDCVRTRGFFGSSPEGQALTAELIAEFGSIILGQRGLGLSITVSTAAIAANIFANNPPAPAPMNRSCGSARVSEYQQLYAQLLTANLNVLNLQRQDVTVCREALDLIQGANTFHCKFTHSSWHDWRSEFFCIVDFIQ